MSHFVNPPPQLRIPDDFFKDANKRNYFERVNKILFQLWARTGGPIDLIDDAEQDITSAGSRIARNAAKINALEKVGFDIEIITADFTTSKNQIIICNNSSAITVTLDTDPIEEDEVHIKRQNAQVTVVGTIDGFTNKIINVQYYSMHLIYDGSQWVEI